MSELIASWIGEEIELKINHSQLSDWFCDKVEGSISMEISAAIADATDIAMTIAHSKINPEYNQIYGSKKHHTLKTHSLLQRDVLDSERKLFGLRSSLAVSLAAKFGLFLVGVTIVGLTSTRGELSSCSGSSGFPFFVSPWQFLEAYTDYRDLYLKCLVNPFLSGSGAYNLPIVYNYPPLFLYTLAAFALEPLAWFPAISLVLFDALTVIPIYLIAKDFVFSGNSKYAFAVSFFWVFNPLNLFYNDFLWLNPGPTTFFLMLGIYFFLKQKWLYSSIVLAISTGFKQTAVIVFPVLIVIMLKTIGLTKKTVAFVALYISSLVIISSPYVFQIPQSYFWSLQLPIFGNPPGAGSSFPTTFSYDLSQPTRLTTFLGLIKYVNLQSLALASYHYLDYVFVIGYLVLIIQAGVGLANFPRLLVHYLRLFVLVFKWILGRIAARSSPTTLKSCLGAVSRPNLLPVAPLNGTNTLLYSFTAMLLFFTFFGRGVYKYYFAGLTPLALPMFSSKKSALLFEAFSLVLLFIPREVTPWMALLLITLVPNLISHQGGEQVIVPAS